MGEKGSMRKLRLRANDNVAYFLSEALNVQWRFHDVSVIEVWYLINGCFKTAIYFAPLGVG